MTLSTCTEPKRPPEEHASGDLVDGARSPPAPIVNTRVTPPTVDETSTTSPRPTTQVYPGTGVFLKSATPAAAGGADANAAPGDTTLNFVDADIRDVVRFVLGNVLQLNYAIDPNVQGKITVQTSRPLKREAVLGAFEQLLHASGFALIEASGIYRVVLLDDAARSGAGSVSVNPASRIGGGLPSYNIQIVPLKYISAAEIQRTLEPFVPKGDLLQVDATRNLIIFSGSSPDIANLSQLLQSFDVNYLSGMSFAIVQLDYGSPKTIADELKTMFGPQGSVPLSGMLRFAPLDGMNAILVISPQRDYLEQARTWIQRLDSGDADNTPRLFEYHVQNSRAVDVAKVLGSLFGTNDVRTVQPQTAPGTTATQIGGSSTDNMLGLGGVSGGLGQAAGGGGAPGQGGALGQLGSGAAPAGGAAITGLANGQAPPTFAGNRPGDQQSAGDSGSDGRGGDNGNSGQTKLNLPAARIVADEKNNTLVIFTSPRTYRMIAEAMKKIDVVPLQVLIEATVAEVTLNKDLQFGLQWFVRQGNNAFGFSNVTPFPTTTSNATTVTVTGTTTTPSTSISPVPAIASVFPGFNYVLNAGSANVVLSALTAVTNVHVISSPQLLVLDHGVATLQVGDEVPIPTAQIQSTLTAGAPLVNTIQYVNTGVILNVSPRVNVSGLITLDIKQEVSAPITTSTSSLNGPTIQQRRIESSVVVQDGETIALGGLIQDSKSTSKNGIPILSSIPVLGNLFSTTDNSDNRTELLILLSPKVVHDAREARVMTDELRGRLHDFAPFTNSAH